MLSSDNKLTGLVSSAMSIDWLFFLAHIAGEHLGKWGPVACAKIHAKRKKEKNRKWLRLCQTFIPQMDPVKILETFRFQNIFCEKFQVSFPLSKWNWVMQLIWVNIASIMKEWVKGVSAKSKGYVCQVLGGHEWQSNEAKDTLHGFLVAAILGRSLIGKEDGTGKA